jgi:hypothetical protein
MASRQSRRPAGEGGLRLAGGGVGGLRGRRWSVVAEVAGRWRWCRSWTRCCRRGAGAPQASSRRATPAGEACGLEIAGGTHGLEVADDARLEMAHGRRRRRWAAAVGEGQEGTTCRVCHRRGWEEGIGGDSYKGGDDKRLGGGDRGN